MTLTDIEQIQRKLLLILRLQGGRWSQEEFDRIDSGDINVGTHLRILSPRASFTMTPTPRPMC